jgi:hypothetical protein
MTTDESVVLLLREKFRRSGPLNKEKLRRRVLKLRNQAYINKTKLNKVHKLFFVLQFFE